MSNEIRCPECGSRDVECVKTPHHDHICFACGHRTLPEQVDLGGGMVVPLCGPVEDDTTNTTNQEKSQ